MTKIFIVEQNRDAQMRSLLILDLEIDPKKLISILHYNGNPIHADFIVDAVMKNEQKRCCGVAQRITNELYWKTKNYTSKGS